MVMMMHDDVGSFADIVMFYFIEVDLFNYKSKLIVLKELLNSMKNWVIILMF